MDLIVVQKHHPSTCQQHRRRRTRRHARTGPPWKRQSGATCQRRISPLIHTSGGTCFSERALLAQECRGAAAGSHHRSLPQGIKCGGISHPRNVFSYPKSLSKQRIKGWDDDRGRGGESIHGLRLSKSADSCRKT